MVHSDARPLGEKRAVRRGRRAVDSSHARGLSFWSALTCQRFRKRRPVAALHITALPPDVRRGLCPAEVDSYYPGCAPGPGSAPFRRALQAEGRTRG